MEVLEIRASLLEKDKDGKHTKHVGVEITNPVVCEALAELIAEAIATEQANAGVKGKDQLTLDNCDDAHKFELTGKKADKSKTPAA